MEFFSTLTDVVNLMRGDRFIMANDRLRCRSFLFCYTCLYFRHYSYKGSSLVPSVGSFAQSLCIKREFILSYFYCRKKGEINSCLFK
jgi:hypothetical protein